MMGVFCGCGSMDKEVSDNYQSGDLVRINKQIELQLREDKKKLNNTIKILLLGCGEAGKSTFIKQMQILHSKPEQPTWTEEELRRYRRDILSNAIQCLQVLLEEVRAPLQPGLDNTAARLRGLDREKETDQSRLWEWRDTVQAIWEDPAIVETYKRRNLFHLPDCCRHFLSDITRISAPDFVPESKDILQIRVKTTGIVTKTFELKMNKNLTKECIMIDVGGQRTERKKWIHCFSDVLVVMFLAAASEYDQVLEEDSTENRMEESLSLFKTIISYHWFSNSSIVLFLNKKDLLEEKIKTSPIEDYLPDFLEYKGYKTRDFRAAMDFITYLYKEEKKAVESSKEYQQYSVEGYERNLYIHETMATDTDNIKKVFDDVKNTILHKIFEQTIGIE